MQLPTHRGGISPGDRVTLVRICLSLADEFSGDLEDKTEAGSEGDWLTITRCLLRQITVWHMHLFHSAAGVRQGTQILFLRADNVMRSYTHV